MSSLSRALHTIGQILRHPVVFYRGMPQVGGLSVPLAFALGLRWAVRLMEYFLGGVRGRPALELMQSFRDHFGFEPSGFGAARGEVFDWMLGAGNVLADPFYSLFRLLGGGGLLFLAASLLTKDKARYESIVRILCAAQAAVVLSLIPGIGYGLAGIYGFVLTVIGLREVLGVSTMRAATIASLPSVLMVGVFLWAMVFVAVLVLGLVSVLI